MNPLVQSAINSAVQSLHQPVEPDVFVTKVGALQIERKGAGDVQELQIGKERKPEPNKLDGNISPNDFERVW